MRHRSPTSKSGLRLRLALFDFAWALVAPLLALFLRDPGLLAPGELSLGLSPPYIYALVTTATTVLALLVFRVSDGMSRYFSAHDALTASGAVATAVGASSVLLFMVTRLDGVPRSTPVICGLVMLGGMLFARALARIANSDDWPIAADPSASEPRRRVLLIGVDHFAAIAIKLVDCQRPRTTEIVAVLDPRASYVGRRFQGVRILGGVDDLDGVIDEYAVHGVVINEVWRNENVVAPPALQLARLRERCASRGLRCVSLAEALNLSQPTVAPSRASATVAASAMSPYFGAKRLIDLAFATVLALLITPLFLTVAGLVLFDLGAPVLFWQERVGRNGRKFQLYKFRTLQAPIDGSGEWAPEARRLSRIGRALRASRLDELPQLINVISGHMSIVGPRPLLPQDQPADPRARLTVRPGITGWAQINGGVSIGPEDKDALDTWYIRHASWLLDALIVLRTALFLATGEKLDRAASPSVTGSEPNPASAQRAARAREAA